MPSTVEKLNPTRVKLTIEVPFSDLKPTIDRVYKEVSQQVQIPGFRKGKVPARIIDQRFGRGAILQDAINDYLPKAYVDALTANDVFPLGQPEIEITKIEDNEQVEFTAEVDVRPEFTVADPASVSVEVDPIDVTDEQIDSQVSLLQERFAEINDVDRAAKVDDLVVLDINAAADGKPLDDATASDVTYRVGQEGFIDGLDKAVKGKKAGDEVTFTTSLVGGGHAGEQADVTVVIKKVQERKLPEVDDDFAQMVSSFDTVEDMRIDLKQGLERQARVAQATQARDKVLAALIEATPFELPEKLVEDEAESRRQSITERITAQGMTVEQYLKEADEETKDVDEFWKLVADRGQEALRGQIILDKLTEQVNVEVSQQEMLELIYQKAMMNGTSPETELKHMMDHDHQMEWTQELRRNKILSALVGSATVKDTNGVELEIWKVRGDGNIDEEAERPGLNLGETAKSDDDDADAKPKAKASKAKAAKAKDDEAKAAKEAPKQKASAKKAATSKAKAAKKESADDK